MRNAYLEGNELIVMGALDAGCTFFAGYPITPATSILLGMVRELPARGGIAIQAEDEIASIGFCIGASLAGAKAMTASSGPGLSLYSENIGLAIMGETPLVIVDVQRMGPATGSATKTASGDVQFVRWGTSGGYPIIALAPSTPEECYSLTIRAFNFAEEFRSPVFLLSDKELSLTRVRVDLDALERVPPVARKAPGPGDPYLPYRFDAPEEVPPMSPMGGGRIVRFTTSTHDEKGFLLKDPERIARMMEHLVKKIDAAADRIALVEEDLQPGAETLVVSYGVTAQSAREAVAAARARGAPVAHLVVKSLWPVPESALLRASAGVRRVLVPELNHGQYLLEVRRALKHLPVEGIHRVDTTLLRPAEILAKISSP